MATVLPSLNSLSAFPRNHARPAVRPRIVPECISVLSEDDSTDDMVECALPPPVKMATNPCAKNAIVNYNPKQAKNQIPRAPRPKVVRPHRNALVHYRADRPGATIVKRKPEHTKLAVSTPARAPGAWMDETRNVIEAAVRVAHLDRYMLRKDVLDAISRELRRRGYADSVIDLLMQTSYRPFNVNSVYYDTFEKQTVCVYKDGDWVPYEVTHYHLFDGFQAYRINDAQCVERVSINNNVKWKWPE